MTPMCPHCHVEMQAWQPPPEASWDSPYLFICFNDACPAFVRSSAWMKDKYAVSVMYRHRIDPRTGSSGSIPVWSVDALRDGILREGQLPEVSSHDETR